MSLRTRRRPLRPRGAGRSRSAGVAELPRGSGRPAQHPHAGRDQPPAHREPLDSGSFAVRLAVGFVEVDPTTACDIALHLVETFGDEAGVAPHAGVGFGPLVARGGDYYGSVVNVASRIADLAVPGELLVTDAVHDAVSGSETSLAFEPAGRRMLKGFAEPVSLWSVTRSRPAP